MWVLCRGPLVLAASAAQLAAGAGAVQVQELGAAAAGQVQTLWAPAHGQQLTAAVPGNGTAAHPCGGGPRGMAAVQRSQGRAQRAPARSQAWEAVSGRQAGRQGSKVRACAARAGVADE